MSDPRESDEPDKLESSPAESERPDVANESEASANANANASEAPPKKKKKKKSADKAAEAKSASGEFADLLAGRAPLSFLIIVVGLLLAFTLRGIRHDSPTEDEWAHLVRGIGYYQTRDMRMHVQHPPLANVLDALPSAFDNNPDVTQMKTWQEGYAPGLEYIKIDYAHAREQLFRGRYVSSLFLVGLAVYVFYFCLSVFGWPTAAAAVCLVAFNPTLIGQARYVATDMPVATFSVIACGELARYLMNSRRIFTLGLALSGLVLSKHSGIVLLGIVVLVALLAALFRRGIFKDEPSPLRRVVRWLGHFALAGLMVVFAINAVYKFDRTGMSVRDILAAPEPQHWVTKSYHGEMLEERSPLPKLPGGLRIPLPYSYLFGLFAVQEQNRGGYPSYFMGKQTHSGNMAYFPVLLLTKDPPALLALGLVGLAVFWHSRKRKSADAVGSKETFFLGLSIPSGCFVAVGGLFLLFIMRSHLNMGVRHGIPVMALASVLAGRAFARAHELLSGKWLQGVQYVAFTGVVSTLLASPHYLNYYNLFALGRGSWINVVGDDWGQDREAFVRFVKQQGIEPLYYHTQTPTRKLEVDYLGLDYKELSCKTRPEPGSWAAIHVQYVHRFETTPKCAPWMRDLEPTYKFNDNIWIYKIPAKN